MTRTALVLAAHGSRVDLVVNEPIRALAARIAATGMFDEVTPAYHQGTPTFATVLDGFSAKDVIVVPVMTSGGYYCDEVLPRELRKNARFGEFRVHPTPPVGTHPAMSALVGSRAAQLASEFGMRPDHATLALVGHGTARNPSSRIATEKLAAALVERGEWAEVLTVFLDEQPAVETVLSRATHPDIMVIPFLISAGPHATRDIPERLGVSHSGIPPISWEIDGRRVVCARAIGTDEGLFDIIVELATGGMSNSECPIANEQRVAASRMSR